MNTNTVVCADVFDFLRDIPDGVVQTCITSPPYWNLRDYGVKGQLGLEATPELFVAKMVEVFAEVRRVLRDDGTLWLVLGDSYAGSGRGRDADGTWNPGEGNSKQATNVGSTVGRQVHSKSLSKSLIEKGAIGNAWVKPPRGFKAKDLIGIPWRVAFALQADGWWLRQDIIWSKPNPMPESVTDRCTKAHEYIFLLSKSGRYYYDAAAIKEPAKYYGLTGQDESGYKDAQKFQGKHSKPDKQRGAARPHTGFNDKWDGMTYQEQCSGMRNKRSVWTIATEPCPHAHFATFPTKLVDPCILAGSKHGDIVLDPFCGKGTTAKRAKELRRRYLTCDLNPEYCKLAEQELCQVELF